MSDEVKLCACGCGEPAPIATETHRNGGVERGKPQRYVRGHYRRGRAFPRRNGPVDRSTILPSVTVEPVLTEEWRPVPNFSGYEVSNLGEVRSFKRGPAKSIAQRATHSSGYLTVSLWRDGQRKTVFTHQIVAAAFYGPRPEGMEVRHLDGNPKNPRLDNLRYGTKSENARDRFRHGTQNELNKTHCPQGHPYDDENTYWRKNGHRQCRICVLARSAESWVRRSERSA